MNLFARTMIGLDGISLMVDGNRVQAVYVQTTDDTEEARLQDAAKVADLFGLDSVAHFPEGASMDVRSVSSIID
jgi:hypothetical protein